MNKLFFLILSFFSTAVFAQPAGFTAVSNTQSLQTGLNQNNARLNSISSDFLQTKSMALLSEKIKSKGTFHYKKNNKVRIQYQSPFNYLMVLNNGQMLVKDEMKTSKVNTRGSKTMQSVNNIMIDVMEGSVFSNEDFKVVAFENKSSYLLRMFPKESNLKKLFESVDIYLNKNNFDVKRLVMNEQGGDVTDMHFSNIKHNISLNEILFKVK